LVFTVPDDLREIYLSFGIDLERHNADPSWTLPMPARYLIGKDGVIIDEPADLLKKLEGINP
jgi:peroxiredoxin